MKTRNSSGGRLAATTAMAAVAAVAAILALLGGAHADTAREQKALGIFNIVKFDNGACRNADDTMDGFCYKEDECMDMGGTVSGNCAAGFGKCCMFTTSNCTSTITRNGTYITNPGYPKAVTTAQSCKWTVDKVNTPEICFVRIDFEKLTVTGPALTAAGATKGGCDTDVIEFSSGGTITTPKLCGDLTGQHIYLEPGRGGADPMIMAKLTGAGNRMWKMRVTQIPCGGPSTPPTGCQMYFTEVGGQFTSYNWNKDAAKGYHLNNMDYNICIREAAGFCSISYTPVGDGAFGISSDKDEARTGTGRCIDDYIYIREGHNGDRKCVAKFRNTATGDRDVKDVFNVERFCGNLLNCKSDATFSSIIYSSAKPFMVRVKTSDNDDAAHIARGQQGINFAYNQIPC